VQLPRALRIIGIFLVGAVRRAVNLDDDPVLASNEIDQTWSDRTLPTKFRTIESTIAS
jgi:hypothetical protein